MAMIASKSLRKVPDGSRSHRLFRIRASGLAAQRLAVDPGGRGDRRVGTASARRRRSANPAIAAPARLDRQALRGEDPEALIQKGDAISIHMRTAYLKDFEAIIGHPLRSFRPNGEIAIVVKAFEFGKGKDFKFGPDAVREGRLVFYSADVDKGQVLNFDNLPVYGPITYDATGWDRHLGDRDRRQRRPGRGPARHARHDRRPGLPARRSGPAGAQRAGQGAAQRRHQ